MPCGNFKNCVMCHNLKLSLTIIMNDGDQYFKNKIIFMSKNLQCHVSNFNIWMTMNDINMTSWVQL